MMSERVSPRRRTQGLLVPHLLRHDRFGPFRAGEPPIHMQSAVAWARAAFLCSALLGLRRGLVPGRCRESAVVHPAHNIGKPRRKKEKASLAASAFAADPAQLIFFVVLSMVGRGGNHCHQYLVVGLGAALTERQARARQYCAHRASGHGGEARESCSVEALAGAHPPRAQPRARARDWWLDGPRPAAPLIGVGRSGRPAIGPDRVGEPVSPADDNAVGRDMIVRSVTPQGSFGKVFAPSPPAS